MNHDEEWLRTEIYNADYVLYENMEITLIAATNYAIKLAKTYAEHMQQERTTGDYVHLLELALSGQTRSNTLLEEANVSYAGIQDELFVAHERIAELEEQRAAFIELVAKLNTVNNRLEGSGFGTK